MPACVPPVEVPYSRGMANSELLASNQERDRAVDVLRVAAGDGRLTAAELDQRLEVALTARTRGELAALTADLPTAGTLAAEPKDLVRIGCERSSASRHGGWVVPRRIEYTANSGSLILDFTAAVITEPSLRIDVDMAKSSLRIITRPGVVVDASEVAVKQSSTRVHPDQGDGLLRVELYGWAVRSAIAAGPASPRGLRK